VTRRRLLASVLVAIAGIVTAIRTQPVWDWLRRRLVALGRPRLDATSGTGALSGPELHTILAFAEVLVGDEALAAQDRTALVEHVEHRTRGTAGYLALYRTTARLLDGLGHASFATLGRRDRAALVDRHQLRVPGGRMRDYLLPIAREALTVRVLAVPDLIVGYYQSPAGWRVAGYEVAPGRCSDLSRYTVPGR
jgi:hypothetical protein